MTLWWDRARWLLAILIAGFLHLQLLHFQAPVQASARVQQGTYSIAMVPARPSTASPASAPSKTQPVPKLLNNDSRTPIPTPQPEPERVALTSEPQPRILTQASTPNLSSPISSPSTGAVSTPPESVVNLPPAYPDNALFWGMEGMVVLDLHIVDGAVSTASITRSSGFAILDTSAQVAAIEWVFPELESTTLTQQIRFRIDDAIGTVRMTAGENQDASAALDSVCSGKAARGRLCRKARRYLAGDDDSK